MSFSNQNWQEFCKLYKLQLPDFKEAEYYLSVLAKCPGYEWIPDRLAEFKTLVTSLETGTTATDYKFKQMQRLVEWFKTSPGLKALEAVRKPEGTQEFDKMNSLPSEHVYISIDLKQANYSVWRKYDQSLPPTWEELMIKLEVAPALANSKSFRQIVFGNLNPKRLQQAQAAETYVIKGMLESEQNPCVRWSADEVTFAVPIRGIPMFISDYIAKVAHAYNILANRITVFKLEPLPDLGSVQVFYTYKNGALIETKRELFGVPGNLMFIALKEHILKEPVVLLDLLFRAEGRKAYWAHPALGVDKTPRD